MKYWFEILIVLLATSCNNSTEVNTNDDDTAVSINTDFDSTNINNINTNVNTPSPNGIYKTTLPCINCPGIEHTIAFYEDNTYRLEEKKLGKKPTLIQNSGSWKPTSGIIYLYDDGIAAGRYQWKGDTLQYLKGTSTYAMQKLQSALDVRVWKNKKIEGIEFFGIGNEPFWNVEVDEQKDISFHLAEWSKPMRFKAVKPVRSSDSISYNAKNDSATIGITIYNTFCSDGMSDNVYDSRVKVVFNSQTYNGCGILYK